LVPGQNQGAKREELGHFSSLGGQTLENSEKGGPQKGNVFLRGKVGRFLLGNERTEGKSVDFLGLTMWVCEGSGGTILGEALW